MAPAWRPRIRNSIAEAGGVYDEARAKLVVIGNGMAPGRALEKPVRTGADSYDVTIFNAEPRVNYDRIMLSPVLVGREDRSSRSLSTATAGT